MDSIPGKVKFKFHIRQSDILDFKYWHEVLLRICGDFHVFIDGELFYGDQDFCLVEFASQLVGWVKSGRPISNFRYISLEFGSEPMFSLLQEGDFWRMSADGKLSDPFSLDDIYAACMEYISTLRVESWEKLRVDITPQVDGYIFAPLFFYKWLWKFRG